MIDQEIPAFQASSRVGSQSTNVEQVLDVPVLQTTEEIDFAIQIAVYMEQVTFQETPEVQVSSLGVRPAHDQVIFQEIPKISFTGDRSCNSHSSGYSWSSAAASRRTNLWTSRCRSRRSPKKVPKSRFKKDQQVAKNVKKKKNCRGRRARSSSKSTNVVAHSSSESANVVARSSSQSAKVIARSSSSGSSSHGDVVGPLPARWIEDPFSIGAFLCRANGPVWKQKKNKQRKTAQKPLH